MCDAVSFYDGFYDNVDDGLNLDEALRSDSPGASSVEESYKGSATCVVTLLKEI